MRVGQGRFPSFPSTRSTSPDREARQVYPGEAFVERAGGPQKFALVPDCDHFYGEREQAAVELIAGWFARSAIKP